jgi:hypothetical protein
MHNWEWPEGEARVEQMAKLRLVGKDPSHTTAGILAVSSEPRDQVNVEVRHSLPRRRPIIDSDVVSVGPGLAIQALLRFIEHGQEGLSFFHRQIKE